MTLHYAAIMGTCPLSSTCTRTGALGTGTCYYAADNKHWDCLQYLVDNKCPGWEIYAKNYARAPQIKCHSFVLTPANHG